MNFCVSVITFKEICVSLQILGNYTPTVNYDDEIMRKFLFLSYHFEFLLQ